MAKEREYLILRELKQQDGLSVRELASRLKMPYLGVRESCINLAKKGYLITWRRPKDYVGRPEKEYRLSGMAQRFFPEAANHFVMELFEAAQQIYGKNAIEKILFRMNQLRIAKWGKKLEELDFSEKVKMLAKLRTKAGYMSEVIEGASTFRIMIAEYHSPLRELGAYEQILNRLDQELFSTLLQCEVIRTEERKGEMLHAYYYINRV